MINKVTLLGRLGKDAEVKSFDNGNSVINFSLATSEIYKDKEGNKQEQTEWHNVAYFVKNYSIAEYLKKGSLVYVDGQIKTRSYESNGEKRYITEIIVNGFNGRIKIIDFAKDEQNQRESQNTKENEKDDLPF